MTQPPPVFVLAGDCVATLATFPDASIDAVVTDPPYELGFMGKAWDRSGVAFDPATWAAVLRVLKPGGHMLAFSGTRTYHRMVCAIEDAGFEIRDQLAWMYGTGFPKSLDVGRAIDIELCSLPGRHYDKTLPKGDKAQPDDHLCPAHPAGDASRGHGTALKPATEPIVLARKPLIGTVAANVLAHGTGAINVDGCRIGTEVRHNASAGNVPGGVSLNMSAVGMPDADGRDCVGRWPANVLLDEHAAAMLDAREPEASRFFYCAKASRSEREAGLGQLTDRADGSDGLNSPRAGAGRTSGRRNHHPTVKPIALMRYLVRLITPPGGIVLDPFTGSGTTGIAAACEGFGFVGCELSPEYCEIATARIVHHLREELLAAQAQAHTIGSGDRG